MKPPRLQVYCATGYMLFAWISVCNVRSRLRKPFCCTDKDGPHTRLRWIR